MLTEKAVQIGTMESTGIRSLFIGTVFGSKADSWNANQWNRL